jgi:predicted CXXCH cytochrome family protein
VRAVVAYPALSVALVVSVALALTSFGSSQVMALGAAAIPLATTAPTPTTTDSPTTTTAPTPTETTSPSATPTPSSSSVTIAAPGAAPGDHHVIARIEGPQLEANYFPVDAAVPDAAQFQTFRVRFRLHNAGADSTTAIPRLDYRPEGTSGYLAVPEQPTAGIPFHVAREWVPSPSLSGGTMQSALGEDIGVASLRIGDEPGLAVTGHHSMGANPDQPITLPPASYTEEEFTLTLSVDAKYLTSYELRITSGGTPLTGTDVATIRLGAVPDFQLSPGQRDGVAVVDPAPASVSAGAAYPLLSAQSIAAMRTQVSAVPAISRPSTETYPLTATTLSAATLASSDIHGPYTITADQCAACHGGHAAQAPNLLVKGSQSALCFSCHGAAAGAATNVQADYPVPPVSVNAPDAREYYSHDALAASTHTRSDLDEFGGVRNRHSECADCHNSHKAGTNDGTQTTGGWDASGRLAGISGVSVVNGAPGSAPTYTFLSGVNDPVNDDDPATNVNPITLEYQLCFKCHSGFTNLLPPIAGQPSKDQLDKAVELNPANPSFHPVEAAGKNDTDAMKASLTKTSPYKLWNFNVGSTIRCLNCHASGTTPDTDPTPLPLPGSALAPHTSSNRGILLKNYQDRVLKSTTDAYSAGDFALCYVCHGEEPFAPNGTASTATNFSLHSKHLTGLALKGDGVTDIDKAGAGQGNAICAECHFRIHSTTNKVGIQAVDGTRLVSFAPNVQSNGGTLSWAPGATGSGTCTLTCHGHDHTASPYSATPTP